MAAIKRVSGSLREVWEEIGQQAGAQVVLTGIRIDRNQFSRIQGTLAIGAVIGTPSFSYTLAVVAGCLQITITNSAAPGNTGAWVLDVMLTHSMQQVTTPADPGIILIVGGGLGAPSAVETLHQAYDVGGDQPDQTIVLADVKGQGVRIDGSTAAVNSSGYSLEIRQNALHDIPFIISRYIGGRHPGPNMQFYRARGTPSNPSDIVINDELGVIEWYGSITENPILGARVVGVCLSLVTGLQVGLDFYTKAPGSISRAWEMFSTNTDNVLTGFGSAHILPDDPVNTSTVGDSLLRWNGVYAEDLFVYANMHMGGGAVGGGANRTIMLTNTATMPAPQADQVYLGALDWTGAGLPNGLASLALSAEAEVVISQPVSMDTLIPIMYNGIPYHLLAKNMGLT